MPVGRLAINSLDLLSKVDTSVPNGAEEEPDVSAGEGAGEQLHAARTSFEGPVFALDSCDGDGTVGLVFQPGACQGDELLQPHGQNNGFITSPSLPDLQPPNHNHRDHRCLIAAHNPKSSLLLFLTRRWRRVLATLSRGLVCRPCSYLALSRCLVHRYVPHSRLSHP